MQHFDDYQTFTDVTLVVQNSQDTLVYFALGLVGEAGEYAAKISDLIQHYKSVRENSRNLPLSEQDLLRQKTLEEALEALNRVVAASIQAEILKKEIRSGIKELPHVTIFSQNEQDDASFELGDLCYYVAQSAKRLKKKFSEIIMMNVAKTTRRMKNNTVIGSGDHR